MATPDVDGKDGVMDNAKANAKDVLLAALFSKNHSDIEIVLQKQPTLVNFDYKNDGRYYGTPLQIACSSFMAEQDEEKTGLFIINFKS